MSKIKVLIVDDSAFMRKAIENMIIKDRTIEVVGEARNGQEAIDLTDKLGPDVVTLDIAMPIMDGVEALKVIMNKFPRPVIMVSSLTTEGAEATMDALDLGAVDFITKDKSFASFGILKIEEDLISKIKYFGMKFISSKNVIPHRESEYIKPSHNYLDNKKPREPLPDKTEGCDINIVSIGTSTGGPMALQHVIPKLPKDFNIPVLVVQHMPPNFTKSLAERLNSLSHLIVVEAKGKELIEPGLVFIAKGGLHLKVRKIGKHYYTELTHEPTNMLFSPSVDVMFTSVANNYANSAVAIIMTGMGKDGLRGCHSLKDRGGIILAQDEESCVVYGMPRVVVEADIADGIVPLDKLADKIVSYST